MANVINKATLQYLKYVSTSKYPINEWIILDTIQKIVDAEAIPQKYWKIVGDVVQEMSQSEKDAADQAIADAAAQAEADTKDIDKLEKATKILAKLTFKEINKLRVINSDPGYTWTQFKNAFKNEWDA